MKLKIALALFVIVFTSCRNEYEDEYILDYYYDLSEIPSFKTRVYKNSRNSEFYFIDINIKLEGKDTIISQTAYDAEFKYDSTNLKIKNNRFKLLEAFTFTKRLSDSTTQLNAIEYLKFPNQISQLTEEKKYKYIVSLDGFTKFHITNIVKFNGFDSLKIKNQWEKCAVFIEYSVSKLDGRLFNSQTDTTYVKKHSGVIKQYLDVAEDPKVFILDTVLDRKDFKIQTYINKLQPDTLEFMNEDIEIEPIK